MPTRGPGRPPATSRSEIRAVAIGLFAAHGYRHVTLSRIAAETGISRTTLFSYFSAKRDIVWEELTARASSPPRPAAPGTPLVDVVAQRVLDLGRFAETDRDALAVRWRVVQDDEELRTYGAAQSRRVAALVVGEVLARAPSCDPRLVDHVVQAVIAVSTRCTEEWAGGSGPGQDLEVYCGEHLRPFVAALRPLLP